LLGPSEAAICETFIVPRYIRLFGDLALEMVVEAADAQVVHVHCRTGYPDQGMLAKLPGAHFYGADTSPAAIELARAKSQTVPGMIADYRVCEGYPVPLPDRAFSHGYSLHPFAVPDERRALFSELARLIAPCGQVMVALPMRGSFVEIADLLREYALKTDLPHLGKSVEAAVLVRPTVDDLAREVRASGFDFVEVELRTATLEFQSGRDFFEDPMTRLIYLPDMAANLGLDVVELAHPLSYVREAIDKYFGIAPFALSVNVGCVSGRRAA
jgi:SAM-dependent methyltransferase